MNRQKFFTSIEEMRDAILHKTAAAMHRYLDAIVNVVIGDKEMTIESRLEDDVKDIIKRIKEAKEDELMKEKAISLIEKIKEEL